MNKILGTTICFAAIMVHGLPALAGPAKTRTLFVMGASDATAQLAADAIDDADALPVPPYSTSTAVLFINNLPEGRGPFDGKIDLARFERTPDHPAYYSEFSFLPFGKREEDRVFVHPDDDGVTEMTLEYSNSEIIGFTIKMVSINTSTDACKVGFHSANGDQNGVEVIFKETHGDDICRNVTWDAAPFGIGVRRYLEPQGGSESNWIEDNGFAVSQGPRCYWMENVTGQYNWVDAYQGDVTLAECKALDSCDRIDDKTGTSGGGCYKYARDSIAPGMAWPAN